MPLEAVQAQAGHASIESTRIYLHLADDWLASQYRKAAEVIDAQVFAVTPTPPPQPHELRDVPDRAPLPGYRSLHLCLSAVEAQPPPIRSLSGCGSVSTACWSSR